MWLSIAPSGERNLSESGRTPAGSRAQSETKGMVHAPKAVRTKWPKAFIMFMAKKKKQYDNGEFDD